MGLFTDERVGILMEQVSALLIRVAELEKKTLYMADQPIREYNLGCFESYYNQQMCNISANQVPLKDVVKAIVKHLDIQIEKVDAKTVHNPEEVKVVEKQPSITLTGIEGTISNTWANPFPTSVAPIQPKPKRKYTKRKTK